MNSRRSLTDITVGAQENGALGGLVQRLTKRLERGCENFVLALA